MMLLVPGRMEWGHIHCNQGHGATLCKNAWTEQPEIKAVVQVYRSLFCLSVLMDMRKRGFGKWFVKWQ